MIEKLIGLFLHLLYKVGFIESVLKFLNKIGIKEYLIPGHIIRNVIDVSRPGDLILVKSFAESTNLLINGTYSHIAVKMDNNYIVDSTGKNGVKRRDMLDLFQGASAVAVITPHFTEDEMRKFIKTVNMYSNMDIGYDFGFTNKNNEMYCSEFVFTCLNDVRKGFLNLRSRFGHDTITPDDYVKSVGKKFKLKYEAHSDGVRDD